MSKEMDTQYPGFDDVLRRGLKSSQDAIMQLLAKSEIAKEFAPIEYRSALEHVAVRTKESYQAIQAELREMTT